MNKVRFGLVGTGRITSWVLKGAVLEPRFQAEAICSRTLSKTQEFARAHQIPLSYDDLDQMLANKGIDAVYIGTPNHTHCDLAIRCMEAGKHVLCEKPLGCSAEEVRKMMKVAEEHQVVLMEAMISTLNPNFIRTQEQLSALGKIRKYQASFCQYSSKYELVREVVAKKDWSRLPASFNPLCGGGALKDIGIYTIYPMVALFGRPEKIHSEIITMKVPVAEDRWMDVDIQGTAEFRYPGMNASISYSKVADAFAPTEICGEEGNLLLDKIHICKKLEYKPHAAPHSGRGQDAVSEDLTCPTPPDEYTCEFTEFIQLMTGGPAKGNNCLQNSLIVAEIMDSIKPTQI